MNLSDEALTRQAMRLRVLRPLLSVIRLSVFCLLLSFHVTFFAQDEPDADVVRVRTDLVTAPAFVTDKQGRRVMNLMATDFELRDDGRVVKIDTFVTGTERVALVFALDASGSTRDVLKQQRETALALFTRFRRGSEVAVICFAETAEMVAPFSNGSDNALRAFELPARTNHGTAIFDAVTTAIRVFDGRHTDATERRIIILISDGLDTISVTRPSAVIDAARNRGVSIYAIQIPLYAPRDGRLRPRPASKGFRDLAERTGGRYFMTGDAEWALAARPSYDLSPIFQAIEDDLRGQYVLGYYPAEATQDGRFHRIDLNIVSKDKRKLRVHLLREGYTIGVR